MFRGILLQGLHCLMAIWPAILITSLLLASLVLVGCVETNATKTRELRSRPAATSPGRRRAPVGQRLPRP